MAHARGRVPGRAGAASVPVLALAPAEVKRRGRGTAPPRSSKVQQRDRAACLTLAGPRTRAMWRTALARWRCDGPLARAGSELRNDCDPAGTAAPADSRIAIILEVGGVGYEVYLAADRAAPARAAS
jgi:hypothetical protein